MVRLTKESESFKGSVLIISNLRSFFFDEFDLLRSLVRFFFGNLVFLWELFGYFEDIDGENSCKQWKTLKEERFLRLRVLSSNRFASMESSLAHVQKVVV